MRSRLALLVLIAGCLIPGIAPSVEAHPVPFSYLDLRLEGAAKIDGTLVAHIEDLAHDLGIAPPQSLLEPGVAESKKTAIADLIKSRLILLADGQPVNVQVLSVRPLPERQAVGADLQFDLVNVDTRPSLLRIKCALFPYDPQHQTFLNVYEDGRLVNQAILGQDHQTFDYYTGVSQSWTSVMKKFIPAGIHHIFTGPDHILFLFGLLLLGGSILRLLSIVTAFTIAHSITLSLAALGAINPSPRLIEPLIALSIVYVGIDNLMVKKTSRDTRVWIAFFFGFVHGFGFAAVLREFGLPRGALGWSLFSFNLGVEIGQACIVVTVASFLAMLRSRDQALGRQVLVVGSSVVILAGSYWFIQRVFF